MYLKDYVWCFRVVSCVREISHKVVRSYVDVNLRLIDSPVLTMWLRY